RHVALIGRRVESDRAHRVVHPFPTRRSSDLPRRRHLQRRGQVRPQLKPVHAPGGIALGHLLVDDPAARGHPLDVARGNRSAIPQDRKSTRLNSSHLVISYAVFCLKKKKKSPNPEITVWEGMRALRVASDTKLKVTIIHVNASDQQCFASTIEPESTYEVKHCIAAS